jgi:hypothetical protein
VNNPGLFFMNSARKARKNAWIYSRCPLCRNGEETPVKEAAWFADETGWEKGRAGKSVGRGSLELKDLVIDKQG